MTVVTSKIDRYREERNTMLDSLLRKILRVGVEELSDDEWGWLGRVSCELRFELGYTNEDPNLVD